MPRNDLNFHKYLNIQKTSTFKKSTAIKISKGNCHIYIHVVAVIESFELQRIKTQLIQIKINFPQLSNAGKKGVLVKKKKI